jgi:hypothetical protein
LILTVGSWPAFSTAPLVSLVSSLLPSHHPHRSKTYWTKSFDNTFIVALDTSSGMGVEYIVDPHFKELFRTGAMSRNYRCARCRVCGVECGVEWCMRAGRKKRGYRENCFWAGRQPRLRYTA